MLKNVIPATIFIFALAGLSAIEIPAVAKETKLMQKQKASATKEQKEHVVDTKSAFKNYKPFTAKVLGNGVRLRLHADVDSPIVRELEVNDLLVVVGEKHDFYAVEAPSSMNVYIFRSFVLDNVVEGARVNIRLQPDLSSPVVGYMTSGEQVNGKISSKNHKWLEFAPPKSVCFYIAKEYLEKMGGPELKEIHDQKMANLATLIESANLLSQSEMLKPFDEIDFQKVSSNYQDIINDYAEFPKSIATIKQTLANLQEDYLKKKLSYLEHKAFVMSKNISKGSEGGVVISNGQTALTSKDRMQIWERVEESLFLSWTAMHHNKTMADYYESQKLKSVKISGIIEAYNDSVKNKPGNYIIRDRSLPRAYIYSTMVDLHNHVGQYVTLVASERPNNNFAFPAYFVMDIE
jgi:hypothetical protein